MRRTNSKLPKSGIVLIVVSTLASASVITTVLDGLNKEPELKPVYEITKKQESRLTRAIGTNGYIGLHKNGCLEPMKEYLNTGKWSDGWCGSHYFHVDWREIR